MSNKAHDHVHRLIHSMSRAEKRYFKLYVGRHVQAGQSNHPLLFDAIATMEVYDEQDLLQRFKGAAFIQRFAITKRRLYETILRSLDAFHSEASLDARIYRGLQQVRILYDRALYEDAAKLLHGVRRLARQHDRQAALFAVMEWERRMAERDNYAHVDQEKLEQLSAELSGLRAEQQELDELWTIKSKLFLTLYRNGRARDEDMRAALAQLLAEVPLKDPAEARSSKARFLYHHIHSAAAFTTDDLVTCYHHLDANRVLLEQERQQFDQEPVLVLSVLSNLAMVCVALGKYDEALTHLKAFRTAPDAWDMPETEDLELKLFSTSYSLELGLYTRLGECDRALALVPAVERGLTEHAARMGSIRRAGLHYQLAYLHLLAGLPDEALRWSNRLLDGLSAHESNELSTAGRLLYLVALYEAGKKDLLAYALRNTERFLKARGPVHDREHFIIGLMRALLRAGNREQERGAFAAFHESLCGLASGPSAGNVQDQFDARAWVEAKLSERSFAAVLREGVVRRDQAA